MPGLEPIAGITIEHYAFLCAQMQSCGGDLAACAQVAERHGVSADRWQAAMAGWNQRIYDPGLASTVGAAYQAAFQAAVAGGGADPATTLDLRAPAQVAQSSGSAEPATMFDPNLPARLAQALGSTEAVTTHNPGVPSGGTGPAHSQGAPIPAPAAPIPAPAAPIPAPAALAASPVAPTAPAHGFGHAQAPQGAGGTPLGNLAAAQGSLAGATKMVKVLQFGSLVVALLLVVGGVVSIFTGGLPSAIGLLVGGVVVGRVGWVDLPNALGSLNSASDMVGGFAAKAQLAQTGLPAQARVLSVRQTGTMVNYNPEV